MKISSKNYMCLMDHAGQSFFIIKVYDHKKYYNYHRPGGLPASINSRYGIQLWYEKGIQKSVKQY